MSFESDALLFAIPAVVVGFVLIYILDALLRRRALRRLGDPRMIALMANSISRRRRVLRAICFIFAMVLCMLALSRPVTRGEVSWRQRGMDIAFVFDFSEAMMVSDVYPNRLDRSLLEAEALMQGLEADRVSTVIFAGGAAHFPLTQDHKAAQLLYRGLRPSHLAAGANLSQGIRLATCVLRADLADESLCGTFSQGRGGRPLKGKADPLRAQAPPIAERARAMVLFTSGEAADALAIEEVQIAESLGIQIFVVGVGTKIGELIPIVDDEGERVDWKRNDSVGFIKSALDGQALRRLATEGRGDYYSLGEGRWRGDSLLKSLQDLKRGDLDRRVVRSKRHIYSLFLFPAFLLLVIEACMSDRKRRPPLPLPGGDPDDEE